MTEQLQRPEGTIAYDVKGSGPLVVCVPGMGDLRSSYRTLVPALVQAGYRVATMDLRGHGDSGTDFTTFDEQAIASDVLALVTELGGPAFLVGNSLGGDGVVRAAASRPAAVAGLVLLDAVLRGGGPAVLRLVFRALLAKPWGPALWAWYYRSLFKSTKPADLDGHIAAIRSSQREPGRFRAFQLTARATHGGTEELLPDVHTPTLVVAGSKDPDLGDARAEAQRQADALHGEVLVIDGAGHYPHLETPEQVVPAVVAFLDQQRAGA